MLIVGAGMAGLLAAHMLRRHKPTIIEQQTSLPNNHDALLRFRSDAVSRATGIPFKKVFVNKAICFDGKLPDKSNIKLSNMYAAKVTGSVINRSILNLEPGERYIAPLNFISQLAASLNIEYGKSLSLILDSRNKNSDPFLTTIPMPAMMKMAHWPAPNFNAHAITTVSCNLVGTDVYQTLYYPGMEPQYRASITGNKLMIEVRGDREMDAITTAYASQMIDGVLGDFGISKRRVYSTPPSINTQKYGKIVPIEDQHRKSFILHMSDNYNIYSIGRFATWRQLLLDDVVKDINLVDNLITERCAYQARLQPSR